MYAAIYHKQTGMIMECREATLVESPGTGRRENDRYYFIEWANGERGWWNPDGYYVVVSKDNPYPDGFDDA